MQRKDDSIIYTLQYSVLMHGKRGVSECELRCKTEAEQSMHISVLLVIILKSTRKRVTFY